MCDPPRCGHNAAMSDPTRNPQFRRLCGPTGKRTWEGADRLSPALWRPAGPCFEAGFLGVEGEGPARSGCTFSETTHCFGRYDVDITLFAQNAGHYEIRLAE